MSNSLNIHRLTIFTQNDCPYCVIMKKKILSWGYDFDEVNVSYDMESKMFMKEEGHKTVPQLYLNDQHLNHWDTDKFTKSMLEKEISFILMEMGDGGVENFG